MYSHDDTQKILYRNSRFLHLRGVPFKRESPYWDQRPRKQNCFNAGGVSQYVIGGTCLIRTDGAATEIPEFRSRVKVEAGVLGSPTLIVLTVSVDVKQHWTELNYWKEDQWVFKNLKHGKWILNTYLTDCTLLSLLFEEQRMTGIGDYNRALASDSTLISGYPWRPYCEETVTLKEYGT